jgi:nitrite reductase/ring-hydroxylating ferredoxin subunit
MRAFRLGGEEIAVVRVGNRFYAFRNACTHRFEYLTDGYVSGGQVICAYHDAVFKLDSGMPVSGPAIDPVPVYAVRVEDGMVQVEWPEALPAEAISPADHSDEDPLARQFVI